MLPSTVISICWFCFRKHVLNYNGLLVVSRDNPRKAYNTIPRTQWVLSENTFGNIINHSWSYNDTFIAFLIRPWKHATKRHFKRYLLFQLHLQVFSPLLMFLEFGDVSFSLPYDTMKIEGGLIRLLSLINSKAIKSGFQQKFKGNFIKVWKNNSQGRQTANLCSTQRRRTEEWRGKARQFEFLT